MRQVFINYGEGRQVILYWPRLTFNYHYVGNNMIYVHSVMRALCNDSKFDYPRVNIRDHILPLFCEHN